MKKNSRNVSGSTGTGTGTGTRMLTDTKTDPRFGPNVKPLARDIVALDTEAESTGSWGIIDRIHKELAEKPYLSREAVKKAVKEELIRERGKEEGSKRSYHPNRAILIAYQYTPEEIATKRASGLTFWKLYAEARSPHTSTVIKEQQKEATGINGSSNGDGKKEEEAPAGSNRQQEKTAWTSPSVQGDSERTDEDMLDILDTFFGGSTRKIKLFMTKLLQRSRVKAAIIEILKEEG